MTFADSWGGKWLSVSVFVHGRWSHLHIGVGEAAGWQVVCVHGHWLLLGSQVLIFVQREGIHRAFIIQAPVTRKSPKLTKREQTQTDDAAHLEAWRAARHSPTSYSAAGGGVGAGHHPGARHCHSVLLIHIKTHSCMSHIRTATWIQFIRIN